MSTPTAPRTEKPVTPESGDPAALLARTQDLSRRLHEREEFYRSILESLGEAVIITDRESRILYANSRIECLTGHPRSELIGAISHELLAPNPSYPAAALGYRVLATECRKVAASGRSDPRITRA